MRNVFNVCMPHAMGDVISGICIAAADSIGYWVPAWYRSNPNLSCSIQDQGQVS